MPILQFLAAQLNIFSDKYMKYNINIYNNKHLKQLLNL